MNNLAGPPVEGPNFFGREKEIAYAWDLLKKGNHLIIPSPRRVGKTSFAKKLLTIAEGSNWHTLEINLEKVSNEVAFIELFIEKIKAQGNWWEKAKTKGGELLKALKSIKPVVEAGGVKLGVEWHTQKANIYHTLSELLDHNQDTLIFLDELTVLLTSMIKEPSGKDTVESFLHWLRDLRQTSGTKIRWVFCSSVGVENFTHAHQISDALNDVKDFPLKAFDVPTSLEMLQQLEEGNDMKLTEGIRQKIVTKLSYCLPYFIQLVFEKMKSLKEIDGLAIDEALVDTAYDELTEDGRFNTWIERIEKQYFEHSTFAFLLLRHICREKEGYTRENLVQLVAAKVQDTEKAEDLVSHLLYMLKNDGYIVFENAKYLFRSPLLRDFWYKRHVK